MIEDGDSPLFPCWCRAYPRAARELGLLTTAAMTPRQAIVATAEA